MEHGYTAFYMGAIMIEQRTTVTVWALLLSSAAIVAYPADGNAQMSTATTTTTHTYDFPGSMPSVTTNTTVDTSMCNVFVGGGDGDGGSSGGDGDGDGSTDPLILDLTGKGIRFLDKKDGVLFDMDEDGDQDLTAWVDGANAGFLVIDKNNDGTINDHSEMFGTETLRGIEHLGLYDSNDDGVIDENDDVWKDLKVWVDVNNDGITDAGELKSLSDLGIESFSLDYKKMNQKVGDSTVISEGFFTWVGGAVGTMVDAIFDFVSNVASDVYKAITGKTM